MKHKTIDYTKEKNIVWHHATVTRKRREKQNQHRSVILWFTGLSSAGKSTLAHAVEEELHQGGCRTFVFDGDNVRHGLCEDLGFSVSDRHENIRRVGEMAKLFIEAGVIALTAFISPFRADRDQIRQLVSKGDFIEVYCKCSLKVCEQRDPKGLYRRARSGEIKEFTGITSPYEIPERPELVVDTEGLALEESVRCVMEFLNARNIVQLSTELFEGNGRGYKGELN